MRNDDDMFEHAFDKMLKLQKAALLAGTVIGVAFLALILVLILHFA